MSHIHGLAHDLPHLLKRRGVLRLAGLGAAATLATACDGWPSAKSEPNVSGTAADGTTCLTLPQETNGPFPADGSNSASGSLANVLTNMNIVRQDIRPNLAPSTKLAEGVRMDIVIRLVNVKDACKPLPKMLVYNWHCDAAGKYSIYELPDDTYLRGVAVTDDKGEAPVTTIFPGCYNGRWPHIHFEVFNGWSQSLTVKDSLLVSQFALPETTCKAVYDAHPAYAASKAALGGVSLAGDGIFRDNTPEQVASQTLAMTGNATESFKATVTVGLALA